MNVTTTTQTKQIQMTDIKDIEDLSDMSVEGLEDLIGEANKILGAKRKSRDHAAWEQLSKYLGLEIKTQCSRGKIDYGSIDSSDSKMLYKILPKLKFPHNPERQLRAEKWLKRQDIKSFDAEVEYFRNIFGFYIQVDFNKIVVDRDFYLFKDSEMCFGVKDVAVQVLFEAALPVKDIK